MTCGFTNPDPCSAIEAGRSLSKFDDATAALLHLPFHTARVGSAARFPAPVWPEVAAVYISPSPPHSCRFHPPSPAPRCRRAKVPSPLRAFARLPGRSLIIADTAKHECVSEEALQHLKTYKYSSVDKSFISRYILKHYVRPLQRRTRLRTT